MGFRLEGSGQTSIDPRRRGLAPDIAFLADHGLPLASLQLAQRQARFSPSSPHEMLIANGAISMEHYATALAGHAGIRSLEDTPRLLQPRDLRTCFQHGIVPVLDDGCEISFLLGLDAAHIRTITSGAVAFAHDRLMIAPRARFEEVMLAAFAERLDRAITDDLREAQPHLSAHMRVTAWQASLLTAFLLLFAEQMARIGPPALISLLIVMMAIFAIPVVLQAAALFASGKSSVEPPQLPEQDLPFYTILAPLHGKAAVAGRLANAIAALDYPVERFEVIFLIESADRATAEALERSALLPNMRILRVPPGQIRTKPRALNLGLMAARGSCITVYDAEDSPHPGQLRSAARWLTCAENAVSCVQAPLLIDNADENALTRMFALEYASLFMVSKPGASRLGLPVPLGGTSNHFRTEVLRRLGGWDARNVTEDADLGMRLFRFGQSIASINEPTYEEAPATMTAWLGQRRRWLKGWFQTALVHSRRPSLLVRDAGLLRALLCLIVTITHAVAPVLFPLSLLVILGLALSVVTGETLASQPEILAWAALPLFAHGLMAVSLIVGGRRAGCRVGIGDLLRFPVYQMMIAIACGLALLDFAQRPFHWRKTQHGLSRHRRTPMIRPMPAE